MKIRKLDDNGDWTFGNSLSTLYINNSLAVAQDLKTKIQEWKGDFFANLTAGIDWRTRLGYKGQRDKLDKDIQKIITDNNNVLNLLTYKSLLDGRVLTITFTYIDRFTGQIQTLTVEAGNGT